MNRELNGLLACGFNKPTVYKIHVFDFEDLKDYTYTDDNLDLVTGYSALNLPVTYKPNKNGSTYSATQERGNMALFTHQLTLSFPKLTEAGRNELIGLKHRDMTVIVEDANGKAWIMGQDFPVRFASLALQIGSSNDYTLVLESTEKEQLKKVVAPDEDCFAAFSAVETHRTAWVGIPRSSFNWNSLTFAANGTQIDYLPPSAFNPQFWNSIPQTKLYDNQKFVEAFELGGNVVSVFIDYDGVGDKVDIIVHSNDTRFDALLIGGSIAPSEYYDVYIQFTATLSPNLENTNTALRLTDSVLGEIYNEPFGTNVTALHPNVSNTSEAPNFNVKDEDNDRTLTLEISSHPNCPTASYTYRHKSTVSVCPLSVSLVDYYKGNKQYVTIRKNAYFNAGTTGDQAPTFQRIELNIDGTVYRLLQTPDKFTSDINVLENTIKTAIAQAGADFIDLDSVEVVDDYQFVRVYFETYGIAPNQTHPHFRGNSHGFGTIGAGVNGWIQSRAIQLQTNASVGSFIKHDHSGGAVEGNYLVDVTSDENELETTPSTNSNSIDNVGFVWAFDENYSHAENENITTEAQADCITPIVTTETSKCYEDFDSKLVGSFFTASISSQTIKDFPKVVEIVANGISYTVGIPAITTALNNHHIASHAFKNVVKGLDLFDFVFDSVNELWLLKFISAPSTTVTAINDLYNGRVFGLSSLVAVFRNDLTKNINSYQKMQYSSLPVIEPFGGVAMRNLTIGEFHYKFWSEYMAQMSWNGSTWKMTIDRTYLGGDFQNQEITFDFYKLENNPFGDNAVIAQSETMAAGVNQIVVDLSVSFADKSTGLYTVLTTEYGETHLNYMNIDTTGIATNNFPHAFLDLPLVWGTRDALYYLGTDITTDDPIVQSTICNGVIIGNATLSSATMIQEQPSEKVKITAYVTGSDRLLIDSGDVVIDPYENGNEALDTPIFSLSSDDGTTAIFETQLFEMSDPADVVGYNYGLEITFRDVGLLTVLIETVETLAEG